MDQPSPDPDPGPDPDPDPKVESLAKTLSLLSDSYDECLDFKRLDPAEVRWVVPGLRKYSREFPLDPNTANNSLEPSEDKQTVTSVKKLNLYPDHPQISKPCWAAARSSWVLVPDVWGLPVEFTCSLCVWVLLTRILAQIWRRVPGPALPSPMDEVLFTPEVLSDGGTSYRFRCPHPGVFRCDRTGLVFNVDQEAELQYTTVQWDAELLQELEGKPAGPLYNIECPENAVHRLHLPHCAADDVSSKSLCAVHISGDSVSVIEPLEITRTHVIIDVPHFSLVALFWKTRDYISGYIKSQVLVFHSPLEQTLSIRLVPGNIDPRPVINEVSRTENVTPIWVTSECKLRECQKYSMDCPDFRVQPPEAEFDAEPKPYYHRKFEVLLPVNVTTVLLSLLDLGTRTKVWEYEVILKVREETPPDSDHVSKLFSVRRDFVQRVSDAVLNQLLDDLLQEQVLQREEMDHMRAKLRADKARVMVDTVVNKGERASEVLLRALQKQDKLLFQELHL